MDLLTDYINRFYVLKSIKESKQELIRNSNQFFKPDDDVYTGKQGIGSTRKGELLDTTGSEVLKDYVTFALGMYFSTESRWFRTSLMSNRNDDAINKVMEQRSDLLFEYISNTNYYTECAQYDWDCIVHGHGLMLIDKKENDSYSDDDIVVRTKNPYNVYFDYNYDGDITDVYWEDELSRREAYKLFNKKHDPSLPEVYKIKRDQADAKQYIASEEDALKTITVINCYARLDPLFFPGIEEQDYEALTAKGYKYIHTKFIQNESNNSQGTIRGLSKSGIYADYYTLHKEKTCFPVRDVRTRSHPYGEGQGKLVLPKARILNKLMADMLKATALQVNPVLSVSTNVAIGLGLLAKEKESGLVSGQEIKPGDIYIHTADDFAEDGKRPIEPLPIVSSINEMHTVYEGQQIQLRGMYPSFGGLYKTARQSQQELQDRLEQQNQKLGSVRANYTREGLTQHLKRFYALAKKSGVFKDLPLPEGVKEGAVDFVFDAFLLASKRVSDTVRLAQALNITSQVVSFKPSMIDWLDADGIMHSIFHAYGLTKHLLNEEFVLKIREQQQAQQQQQNGIEQQQVDAGTIKATTGAITALTPGL